MPMTAAYAPALTHGFEGFLDFLRDQEAGPAVLSPKRFSDVLSIDLQTLAGQAHVHRNTLSRAPASARRRNQGKAGWSCFACWALSPVLPSAPASASGSHCRN